MLFVPGNSERFISKAHTRGADAIILDLEDSVPLTEKPKARRSISGAVKSVSQSGADTMVRINEPLREAVRDLEAAVVPGVRAIVVPKARGACHLNRLSELIGELESEQGMRQGEVAMIVQIETLDALLVLDDMAAVSRVVGMTLGTEDFSADAGMASIPEALMGPSQQILFAARRHRCIPYGFVASIADYSDLDKFFNTINQARQLGFCGALAVHPSQVAVMNEAYLPTAQEIELARRIESEFADSVAKGRGAFAIDGKMIDKPVLDRALQQLAMARRFEKE
ncbi:MAG: CoA ester lyase [Gammaproteobacteria bacterium]|nr:MAG: CoA ester lyase [Gammaproteobacteria bacterium]RLA62039.1 MAG: CoA ester lyase [Gammaproteobacteria bacterium]